MTFKPLALLLLALCASLALHLLLGLGVDAALQGKQAPVILKHGGTAAGLAVRLAEGNQPPAAASHVTQAQPAGGEAPAQAGYPQPMPPEEPTVVSESATSAGHFYSASEVDYPAEFLNQIDFDEVLRGLPMPHAMLRLQIFVDAKGVVKAVRWETDAQATAVMQRLTEYVSTQSFRPAMKGGAAVASRLRLEFEVGRVVREADDLPFIPAAPAATDAR